jgi:hypothetical protein
MDKHNKIVARNVDSNKEGYKSFSLRGTNLWVGEFHIHLNQNILDAAIKGKEKIISKAEVLLLKWMWLMTFHHFPNVNQRTQG